MTSARQYAAIHTLAKKAGLDDGERRALMQHHTGKASSRDLSDQEAGRVIEVLRGFAGPATGPAPRADRASGHYAPVLQALWISGFNLGLVHDRTDVAMMRFVQRQTGIDHTRFLVDQADARRAIEALKKWLERGGVRWAAYRDDPHGRKLAVLEAIAKTLVREGGFTPFLRPDAEPWPGEFEAYGASRGLPDRFEDYDDAQLIALTRWLAESLWAARQLGQRKEARHG